MNEGAAAWDGDVVRTWLERRAAAARRDQAAADRRGYDAQADYDVAAAEEWVCRTLLGGGHADDRTAFAAQIKTLLAQEEFWTTGVHDDRRFDRSVRAQLRRIAKMTKTGEGFANTLHYRA
jgi:hypothetical protein